MSGIYSSYWVEISATDRKTKEPTLFVRGPFDTYGIAKSVAESVPAVGCTVENATVSYSGVDVIGYRSTKGVWTWDAAPKEWAS